MDALRTIAALLLAGATATLSACSGNSSHAASSTTPPVIPPVPVTLLLTSVDGGASLLGQMHELPVKATDPTAPFVNFEGTPWIAEMQFDGHGLVFNSYDNRFYGVLDGTGADALGVLMSFDPATDELKMLRSFVRRAWPAVTGVGGDSFVFEQPYGFFRRPLLSPDGKSLLLRAAYGGVDGRGALIHVNLDASSADFLKDTLVYSFFDFEKSQGSYCNSLRHTDPSGITEMAWGVDSGGAAAVFMAVGGDSYDVGLATNPTEPGNCNSYKLSSGRPMDKIYGRMFALKPTDAASLSKPWVYSEGYAPFDPLLRVGRQIYWDTKSSAIRWTTEAVGGGILSFYVGGSQPGTSLYLGAIEQCYRLQGLLPLNVNGDSVALCSGLNGSSSLPDSPPRIFEYTSNYWFTQQANLGGWYSDRKVFRGATSSLVSRRLFVNGGDLSDSCVAGGESCVGAASSLEELDPATGYVERILASGDPATVGYTFLGDPAVGGAMHEPMADRYVVWFGAVAKGHSNVLNKLDRTNGQLTTFPLDPKSGAHPIGRLLDLGNGKALGLMRRAAPKAIDTSSAYLKGTGGYAGGPGSVGSGQGHYLLDLKTKRLISSISQNAAILQFSMERVRLDDGSVWEGLVYQLAGDLPYRTVDKVDPATGVLTGGFAQRMDDFSFQRDTFVLAGRTSAALYLPFWKANVDVVKGYADMTLGCIRADSPTKLVESDAFGPAQAATGNAHRIVYGATYSAANKAMYVATSKVGDLDQGTIFEVDKNVADADLCLAKPVVTALVTGLTEVPSTKVLALQNGLMAYGSASGKLVTVDVASKKATVLADLKAASAPASSIVGYLAEVDNDIVAAIVYDYDNNRKNVSRRLVIVTVGTAEQSSRDVSQLISEDEPYPGVMRLK